MSNSDTPVLKIPLFISTGILLSLSIALFLSSVSLMTIFGFVSTLTIPAAVMIIGVYFKGVEKVKGTLDTRLSKSFFALRPRPTTSELNKCHIAKFENYEKNISKFFKLFVGMWGFSTSIITTTIQIGTYFGVDKMPQYNFKPLFQIPSQYVTHIPSPDTPESFIFWSYFFGIPFAFLFLVPAALLRPVNLRYVKNDHTIVPIPKYDWNLLSGLVGILIFTTVFFKDVVVSYAVQLAVLNYVILDMLVVGIPLAIFCLFQTWYLEPKLKPKILSYLHDELHIRDEGE